MEPNNGREMAISCVVVETWNGIDDGGGVVAVGTGNYGGKVETWNELEVENGWAWGETSTVRKGNLEKF